MKTTFHTLGKILLLLIPVVFAALLGLMGTTSGMAFLLAVSNRLTAPLLTIGSVSGSLFSTIHLQNFHYADGIDTVRIDSLTLTWDPAQLFSGQVHIRTVHGSGVQVLLGEGSGTSSLHPFSLPFPLRLDALSADNIRIISDQQQVWHIRTGTVSSLTCQGEEVFLRQLTLDSPALAIEAAGHIRTNEGYPLQLKIEATLHPKGYASVQAHGTIQGPLNELAVEATVVAPFPARINGVVNNFLTTATWQTRAESPLMTLSDIQETWPKNAFSAIVVEGQGTLDDYALHLHTQVILDGRSERGDLVAELQGNADGLRVQSLRLRHHTTELSAQGNLAWNPAFSWQAEVRGTGLDPALLHTDWPGDITVALSTSGQVTGQDIKASLHLPKLQGTLRQRQLTGAAELHIDNEQLRIPSLQLQSGGSSLNINGTLAEELNLLFRLDSANLGDLWPGAIGRMSLSGHIGGSSKTPGIDFKLSGDNVGIGASSIHKLQMETTGTLNAVGSINGLIRAEKLQFGTLSVATSQLRLTGSPQRHRFEFESRNNAVTAGFFVDGAVEGKIWRGNVSRMRISSQHHGEWRQQQPISMEASTDRAAITPLCLATSSSTVCAEGSWQKTANSWRIHARTTSLPLAVLYSSLLTTRSLSGLINAEVDLVGQQDQILSARLSVINKDLSLSVPITGQRMHQVTWKNNVLQGNFTKNQLQASLKSEVTDGSVVHATLTSAASRLSLEQILRSPMNGSLQLRILDLSPLIALTNRAVHPSGIIEGQVSISGTPQTPVLKGQLALINGQAEIPPLGITLSPLALHINSDTRNLRLFATAHSGKGMLKAESELQLDRLLTGPYTIRCTGESFLAARIPGLTLEITPDILLSFNQHRAEVRGTVTVPHARITSIDFSRGLSPSADVVVIDDAGQRETGPPLPVFAELTVITGDDVLIDAHGLRGYIDGKLTIHQQPGRPQTGNGDLNVRDGSFTLYGRSLKIGLGRMLFAGGPLSNPGVELRSEKKSEKVSTGVIIDGFLQRPEMHFYSSPFMEQSAIVVNLLESTAFGGETRQDAGFVGTVATKIGLGGVVPYLQNIKQLTMIDEIKFEPGESYDSFSLVFGSWLTPNFYVSYGNDLVKESGSFNTRFNLGSGFYFLTETGPTHSGGDIKYEFEH